MKHNFSMPEDQPSSASFMAQAWMLLACGSLLASGLLALVITAAKMPGLKDLAKDLDLIRWCLVVHVNLATLMWFTAVPLAIVHLSRAKLGFSRRSEFISMTGYGMALIGVILLVSALPDRSYEVILSNYVPVYTHPRFFAGLVLYLLGVTLNYLNFEMLLPHQAPPAGKLLGLTEVRFGLCVGTAFFLMAVFVGVWSVGSVRGEVSGPFDKDHFEVMMWGGGHLLQHSSTAFLLVVWVLLGSSVLHQPLFSRRELFKVFGWLGVPLLAAPLLLHLSPFSQDYRQGFTLLMRWGIYPPVLLFLVKAIPRLPFTSFRDVAKDYRLVSLGLSMCLLILGFVFGTLIRGSDLRVPGHYHASIGAVTLGFMCVSYLILSERRKCISHILATKAFWTFGIGQILFSAGMFVAGAFGAERKAYGSEHTLDHWAQYLGMGTMAVGGLAAFAGGLLFAAAILPNMQSGIQSLLAHRWLRGHPHP